MIGVSAIVLTRNEEKHIERCLGSLAWADEILVVDAESTDATERLCTSAGRPWHGKARFVKRAWSGFRDQRTFALTTRVTTPRSSTWGAPRAATRST